MAITHNPETGRWSFTHGTQTYSGYSTKEAAQEACYDAERGIVPQQRPGAAVSAEQEIVDTAAQVAAERARTIDDYGTCAACGDLVGCCTGDPLPLICDACAADRALPVVQSQHAADGSAWTTWRCGDAAVDLLPDGRGTVILFNTSFDILGRAERAELLALRAVLNHPALVAALEAAE